MLTEKQRALLAYIETYSETAGVPPSYEEMRVEMCLASRSGIFRLVEALVDRGYVRKLPNRARAIEVVKRGAGGTPESVSDISVAAVPMMGKIAAGTPIEAIHHHTGWISVPGHMLVGAGPHFALKVAGDSMINAGIRDGDTIVVKRIEAALDGDIVVALVDGEFATLKRMRRNGRMIVLEAANTEFADMTYGQGRVAVQGKLVGLLRAVH